jgi:hydroxyacylglutathione hydrolase
MAEPLTFILRQNPCADFEVNFIYLLVGCNKALLIDTGAVESDATDGNDLAVIVG